MTQNQEKITRRTFLKTSAVTATGVTLGLHAANAPAIHSGSNKNEKIRVGFIGVGNRGSQLLQGFMLQEDVEVAALCAVYEPYVQRDYSKVDPKFIDALGGRVPKMKQEVGANVARYKDFRKLLDQKDIDAVVIATPDHWHALQTIMACDAGKDVYVEKPLTITILEGRKMVEAAERNKRIVQVGLQRRASKIYQDLAEQIQNGKIGRVTIASAYRISNMFPNGIGKTPDSEPPKGLDWDLWLGPRPMRPYNENIPLYKFRWWKSYSSQLANWGVHYFDAIRWMLGEVAPISVSAHGGQFAVDDDRTIPDTLEVIFELASGSLIVFGQYEANGGRAFESGEIELRGTLGNLYAQSSGYKIVPSSGGQFQSDKPRMESVEVQGMPDDTTTELIRNFLDCIKSRKQPFCDLEKGHRSTTFALLANIALETKSRLEWDPKKERITNNKKANKLLHYEYRAPWKLS